MTDSRACLDETWRAMEKLYEQGICRSIGVSNFSIDDLTRLMETCSVVPHVNPSSRLYASMSERSRAVSSR